MKYLNLRALSALLLLITAMFFIQSCDDGNNPPPTPNNPDPEVIQPFLRMKVDGADFYTEAVSLYRDNIGKYRLKAVKGMDTLTFTLTDTVRKEYQLKFTNNTAVLRSGNNIYRSNLSQEGGYVRLTANSNRVYEGGFAFTGKMGNNGSTVHIDSGTFLVLSSDLGYLGDEVFSAEINEVPLVSDYVMAQHGNTYNISGTTANGKGIHLKLNVNSTGEINLGQENQASYTDKSNSYLAQPLNMGKAVITRLTSTRIEGTYHFPAKNVHTEQLVQVTKGRFALNIP